MYRIGRNADRPLLTPAVDGPDRLPAGCNRRWEPSEIHLDDSTRLAARANAARVDVILYITVDRLVGRCLSSTHLELEIWALRRGCSPANSPAQRR